MGVGFDDMHRCSCCRYMAPEIFRQEQYNNKVDVYSFGMIAYQLAEGMPPFFNMSPCEAAKAAAHEEKRPYWGQVNMHGQVRIGMGIACGMRWRFCLYAQGGTTLLGSG
jgi:serine/threonine protein kinase